MTLDLTGSKRIRPMSDDELNRAIEKAKANRFDEYGNYGENNPPLPEITLDKHIQQGYTYPLDTSRERKQNG